MFEVSFSYSLVFLNENHILVFISFMFYHKNEICILFAYSTYKGISNVVLWVHLNCTGKKTCGMPAICTFSARSRFRNKIGVCSHSLDMLVSENPYFYSENFSFFFSDRF